MSVDSVCAELNLTPIQCSLLKGKVGELCGGRVKPVGRARSRWQECIAARRAGKPFDPQAIRELAKEYKEGKCP